MKKTLALILTVMFLCFACAENGTYVSDTGLFSYQYPEGYTPLSSSTIDEVLADPNMKAFFDAADFDVSSLKSDDGTLMEYLYAPDFTGNMNIVTQPGSSMNMMYIRLLQDNLYQLYAEQYKAFGADNIEFLGFPEFGTNAYFGLKMTMMGFNVEQYLICDNNGTLCIFTFTAFDEEARDTVLNSFTYAAAEKAA